MLVQVEQLRESLNGGIGPKEVAGFSPHIHPGVDTVEWDIYHIGVVDEPRPLLVIYCFSPAGLYGAVQKSSCPKDA